MAPFQAAVNEAAARVRGLWLGFILLLAYLAVSVGAVTHVDLLLENPVKLPVLNVSLPLRGFFGVAPLLLIINHFYLLLMLLGLGKRIHAFNEALVKADLNETDRPIERRKLDSFLVVQMLGGTHAERTGFSGFLLKFIAQFTLIIAPLLILISVQLSFLPYHDQWITWLHRGAVILDLVILWLFWPAILQGAWKASHPGYAIFALTAIGTFCIGLATFPGEWAHRDVVYKPLDCLIGIKFEKGEKDKQVCAGEAYPFRDGLFAGPVDGSSGKRRSVFSNALSLPNTVLIDVNQLEKINKRHEESGYEATPWRTGRTRSLRGRNLQGAVFDRSDLRNADLYNASLEGASLEGASLQGTSLEGASLEGASLRGARLQGASLQGARLQGASLEFARLQGASLMGARLQGASLRGARLQGASLRGASLEGASLRSARLQGALLEGARLQGASLRGARLQGALLGGARLQGASLRGASLKGASLQGASLQGASLKFASLQGASLEFARLHGALLEGARLHGALLEGARLEGALLEGARLQGASLNSTFLWRAGGLPRILLTKGAPVLRTSIATWISDLQIDAPTNDQIKRIEEAAVEGVTDDKVKQEIRKRLQRLRGPVQSLKPPWKPEWWRNHAGRLNDAGHRHDLARRLETLACEPGVGAPYVARRLIWGAVFGRPRLEGVGRHLPGLAQNLLDGATGKVDNCPGVKELDERSLVRLRQWAAGKR